MLTKFKWTVYVNGELFDIMTDRDVEHLVQVYKVTEIDTERGLIVFGG
jgi:hypothetical protein